MGKLGKKARKFAKKNLQSVNKKHRKTKIVFKKRSSSSKGQKDAAEDHGKNSTAPTEIRIHQDEEFENVSLDDIFMEDGSDIADDASDSDGFLSEDSDEETRNPKATKLQNQEIFVENKGIVLNKTLLDSWCQLAKEENNKSALRSLLNLYRAACHYGDDTISHQRIKDGEIFSYILMLMLRDADSIFRSMLKIPSSSSKKEVILEIKNTPKWKAMKPLVKSYLRSTLFLLNQMTDSGVLAFALSQLRASLLLFLPFPSLLGSLIKVAVHMWASVEGILSSSSFLIIRDVAALFSTEYFNTCVIRTYKAYITRSNVADVVYSKQLQFMKNSLVELCSLDVKGSCAKAVQSLERLTYIFKQGTRTKKKETLKKICSSQYANCIDLWVKFVADNMRDHDLHQLYYVLVQLINGVACLFPGPRYFPLRVKCIQWLNYLSSSSGIFVPVASLVLDILEYKVGKEGGKSRESVENINPSSVLKLPKPFLKSRNFQVECLSSAIELLCSHFAQWSYHISFPEAAFVTLMRLKKFNEISAVESYKRVVKRLIDQVEQNVEFVRKKRDEVPFSPKDHTLVESFLQLEKCSSNTPFTQYYKSVIQKAASKDPSMMENQSFLDPKERKRKRVASVSAP